MQTFLNEIKECVGPQELTSILQLCKTVGLQKLAGLAKKDEGVEALVAELLAFKIKSKQVKHKGARSPASGAWTHASAVDCLIKS